MQIWIQEKSLGSNLDGLCFVNTDGTFLGRIRICIWIQTSGIRIQAERLYSPQAKTGVFWIRFGFEFPDSHITDWINFLLFNITGLCFINTDGTIFGPDSNLHSDSNQWDLDSSRKVRFPWSKNGCVLNQIYIRGAQIRISLTGTQNLTRLPVKIQHSKNSAKICDAIDRPHFIHLFLCACNPIYPSTFTFRNQCHVVHQSTTNWNKVTLIHKHEN